MPHGIWLTPSFCFFFSNVCFNDRGSPAAPPLKASFCGRGMSRRVFTPLSSAFFPASAEKARGGGETQERGNRGASGAPERARELNSTARALLLLTLSALLDTMMTAASGGSRKQPASCASSSTSLSHDGSFNRPDTEQHPEGTRRDPLRLQERRLTARLLPPSPGEVDARGARRMCVERIVLLMLHLMLMFWNK